MAKILLLSQLTSVMVVGLAGEDYNLGLYYHVGFSS